MSHEVIDEQSQLIVLTARNKLVEKTKTSKFYSIICDEATDVAKLEQMSVSIRHCTDDYDINEDFLGVMSCDIGLSSASLLRFVTDMLLRCGLSFDGASAMKCLARLVKENINPFAMYFHCFAHCNELVFKDATSSSPLIATSQDLCEDLYALVGVSPKRVLLFQSFQCSDGKSKIKNLSRTRWTTRGPAAEILLHQHKECLATLSNLKDDVTVTPECRAKARGLLRKMQTFEDMFDLKAMQEIAILLEHNSKAPQRYHANQTSEKTSFVNE